MSDSITRLSARVVTDYYNDGHRTWLPGDFNAVAALANLMVSLVTSAQAAADAAAASYALMQSLGASAYGIGSDPLDLPRMTDLGSSATRDYEVSSGIFTKLCNSAYQITPNDHGMLLISSSGTNTWTLADSTNLPDGFMFFYHNISGNNLTVQRTGSTDTINNAATSITIATASVIGRVVKRAGTTIFQIG